MPRQPPASTWIQLGLVLRGSTGLIDAAWCVAITLVGYVWANRLYNRDPAR